MSAMDVGVVFNDRTLFSDRMIGYFDVLTSVIEPFLMVASCGCGHCLLSKASATTFWSGRLTWTLVDSPGMIISLVLTDTSGCLAGVVLYCAVLVLYCTVFAGGVLYCAVPVLYCTGFAGIVLYCAVLILYCTGLAGNVLYCVVSCCTGVLCCTVLL